MTQAIVNDRDETIRTIKTNLKRRGLSWISVTGGRGTAWGWITIGVIPSKALPFGYLTDEQREQLRAALNVEHVHNQGVSIAASNDYRAEYIARSAGQTPEKIAQPYWD